MRRSLPSILFAVTLAGATAHGAGPLLPPDPTAVRGIVSGQYHFGNFYCPAPWWERAYGNLALAGQFNFGKTWRGVAHVGLRLPCSSTDTVFGPWDPVPMHGTSVGTTSVTGVCTPDWLRSHFAFNTGYLESSVSCEGVLTTSSGEQINWRTTLFIEAVINAEPTCAILGCGASAGPEHVRANGAFFRGVASDGGTAG